MFVWQYKSKSEVIYCHYIQFSPSFFLYLVFTLTLSLALPIENFIILFRFYVLKIKLSDEYFFSRFNIHWWFTARTNWHNCHAQRHYHRINSQPQTTTHITMNIRTCISMKIKRNEQKNSLLYSKIKKCHKSSSTTTNNNFFAVLDKDE